MIRLRHKHPYGNVERLAIVLIIVCLKCCAHTENVVPFKTKAPFSRQLLDNSTNFSASEDPTNYFSKYF